MNLAMILKMLGLQVPPDKVKQIQDLISKIPEIVKQVIATVNGAAKSYDDRLANIELMQAKILEKLDEHNSSQRPAGTGANGRALESGWDSVGVHGAD